MSTIGNLIDMYDRKFSAEEDVINAIKNGDIKPDEDNNLPLIYAVAKNYVELARFLLKTYKYNNGKQEIKIAKTVNPSARNNLAITMATEEYHPEILKLLLDDYRVGNREQGFDEVISQGYVGSVKVFLRYYEPRYLQHFLETAVNITESIFKQAKQNDVKEEDIKSDIQDNIEIVKALIETGTNGVNDSALLLKAVYNPEVLKLFIENGAIPNNNVFKVCIDENLTDSLQILLKNFDPNFDPSSDNNFLLRYAADNFAEDTVITLLKDIRVDPKPFDEEAPKFYNPRIDEYIQMLKENLFMERVIPQYERTIKQQEELINEMTYSLPSEKYPYGGIKVTGAVYTPSGIKGTAKISDPMQGDFQVLFNYCVDKKRLPSRHEEYRGVRIGHLLDCIINNEYKCKEYREEWLDRLSGIKSIEEELDKRLTEIKTTKNLEEDTEIIESV